MSHRSAWLIFALVLSSTAPALACQDACAEPIVLPRDAWVPTNAFMFKVSEQLEEARLVDMRSQAVIPSSVKTLGPDRVWSPDVPVGVDALLELTYRSSCTENTAVFRTTEPASVDKEASLRFLANLADAPHGRRQTLTNLSFEAPTTRDNYLLLEVEVDGKPYDLAGSPYAPPSLQTGFWAICDAPPHGECTTEIAPTLHEVVFRTRAVGQAKAASEHKITVDLRCDVPREEGVASASEHEEDGCQLGGTTGGWAWLALLLRRRRR